MPFPLSDAARRSLQHCARFALVTLALSAQSALATSSTFKVAEPFTGTTATGWTLSGTASLTAASSIDSVGSGWLRLTDASNSVQGMALYTGGSFDSSQAVVVKISYVAWGGSGADGTAIFLYDATQDMSGAYVGGGLGYCGGAGGYLAIGLDEYGNFSNPGDNCGAASGGPGSQPDSLVIRGPLSADNAYITSATIAAGIDDPYVTSRPSAKTVLLTLTPAALGYTISAQFQSATGETYQTLFSNVSFPYAPPSNLSIGFSASTGGATNIHELHALAVSTPSDIAVALSGPASVTPGNTLSYTLTVTNNGDHDLSGTDAPLISDALPSGISSVSWTCSASTGASCNGASGSGDLDASGATLPVGASLTYTISGTLDVGAVCNVSFSNSAAADFSSDSTFTDINPNDNTAQAVTMATCTAQASAASLDFGSEPQGSTSSAQVVTLSGTGGATVSSIAVSGDFQQSNNCTSALTDSTSCTISVSFAPTAQGTLSGTLSIVTSASSTPITVALTGTGAAPTTTITVRAGGGGTFAPTLLAALALLAGVTLMRRLRLGGAVLPAALLLVVMAAQTQRAEASALSELWPNVTLGARLGGSNSTLDSQGLASALASQGYQVSGDVNSSSRATSFYVSYDLWRDWSLQVGWTYLGRTRATFTGPTPQDMNALLNAAADVTRGGGNTQWLAAQYRYPLLDWLSVDVRAGAYLWSTDSDLYVDGVHALARNDDGFGYTVGVGPHVRLGEHWGLGLSVDYYASSGENRFWQETATLEYHF